MAPVIYRCRNCSRILRHRSGAVRIAMNAQDKGGKEIERSDLPAVDLGACFQRRREAGLTILRRR